MCFKTSFSKLLSFFKALGNYFRIKLPLYYIQKSSKMNYQLFKIIFIQFFNLEENT